MIQIKRNNLDEIALWHFKELNPKKNEGKEYKAGSLNYLTKELKKKKVITREFENYFYI